MAEWTWRSTTEASEDTSVELGEAVGALRFLPRDTAAEEVEAEDEEEAEVLLVVEADLRLVEVEPVRDESG